MNFVADLIACRLNFFNECSSNSEAAEWVPCVAAVDGASSLKCNEPIYTQVC